jgi:hypothetical protein
MIPLTMIVIHEFLENASKVAIDVDAPASSKSSIFLRRIVGSLFMRVNTKCAHQVRPPLPPGYSGAVVT